MAKKIGVLGGMSPESTIEYYQHITHAYTKRFGDHNYPEVLIYSVQFQPYIDWPKNEEWDKVANGLAEAARKLEQCGADFVVIATNTMHHVYSEIQDQINVPLLSIVDAVGEEIRKKGMKKVGLLGTAFTMNKTFYPKTLEKMGIEVITPDEKDRQYVNRVIYNELVAGNFRDESRLGYLQIIDKLSQRGAEGIILGCTEIPLLVREGDTELPLFNTTLIHADAALNFALA